jgi:transposase
MKGYITMSSKETPRIAVLDRLMNKEIKQKHAAQLLNLSVRQVRRILKQYKRDGAKGLVHKSRGSTSNHKITETEIIRSLELIKSYYHDFGPTLAHEKLVELHHVTFSRETLRLAMIKAHLWQPRQRKYVTLHPLRERRSCEGELVQLDGSSHDWFESRIPSLPMCTLLVFIDDATGKLKHLKFVRSESTASYFLATKEYLLLHGKPLSFYMDKHGVFRINITKGGSAETSDSHGLTQFGRAMEELAINMIFAESAEAKGRVERVNQTLQDRLVKEMRLKGISSVEEANQYLPQFIEVFNQKFTVVPKDKANLHRPLILQETLENILCEKHRRVLSKQLTISYKTRLYQITTDRPTYAMRYAPVEVRETTEGVITITYKGMQLNYTVIKQQPKADIVDSKQLNLTVDQLKKQAYPQRAHIPAVNHPWRQPFVFAEKPNTHL